MTFTLKTPQAAIFPKHRRAAVHWRQPFLLPGAKKASFEIGVAPLPYYDDTGIVARGLPPAGAAVWAQRQSVGVTNFFAFLAARAAETRRVRDAMEAELEAVWRGDKTALDALNAVPAQRK